MLVSVCSKYENLKCLEKNPLLLEMNILSMANVHVPLSLYRYLPYSIQYPPYSNIFNLRFANTFFIHHLQNKILQPPLQNCVFARLTPSKNDLPITRISYIFYTYITHPDSSYSIPHTTYHFNTNILIDTLSHTVYNTLYITQIFSLTSTAYHDKSYFITFSVSALQGMPPITPPSQSHPFFGSCYARKVYTFQRLGSIPNSPICQMKYFFSTGNISTSKHANRI